MAGIWLRPSFDVFRYICYDTSGFAETESRREHYYVTFVEYYPERWDASDIVKLFDLKSVGEKREREKRTATLEGKRQTVPSCNTHTNMVDAIFETM